jgi:DNA-directed RNA polymerase subunit RPC12/RpoP
MTPYTIVCNGCASQISKRSKVYSNVTTCGKYLGVSIHEVRIRCPHCASFILFKVNPTKNDYDLVSGAVQLLQEQENPAEDETADGGAADFTGSSGGGATAVDSIESVQQALLNAERIDALTSAAGVRASDLGRARAAVEAGAAATEAEASASAAAAAAAASARNVEWTAKDSEQARADFDAAKARAAAANVTTTAAPTSSSSLLPPMAGSFAFSSASGTFGVFAGDSGAGAVAGVSDLMSSMRAAIHNGNTNGSSSVKTDGMAPTSEAGPSAAIVGRQLDSVLASLLRNPTATTAATALTAPSPTTGGSTLVADASTSGVSGKAPAVAVSSAAVVAPPATPPAVSEETAPVAVNGGRRARRGGGNLLSELTE